MSSKTDQQDFAASAALVRDDVNARLQALLAAEQGAPPGILEALEYVLLSGGKRLRPILCLWTHDALGGDSRDACVDVACALECLHTYSLVHDDLPCMDDDDMRRGQPSCHVKFGEATAVLVGDALLTLCFDVVLRTGDRWELDDGRIVQTTRAIARAAGSEGLITGQALDMNSSEMPRDIDTVDRIHQHKTAALFAACMEAGALVAGADEDTQQRVRRCGETVGRAFQIIDDLLDTEATVETLGKTPGKDARAGRLTYPAVSGTEAARERARALVEEARGELRSVAVAPLLEGLFDFMISRTH
jgi:geranylgeranyl diphosphate synthase type II